MDNLTKIIISSFLFVVTTSSFGQVKPKVHLDSHVHVFFDDEKKLEKDLRKFSQHSIEKAFLISPAYTILSDYDDWDTNGELKVPENRVLWNDRTASIIRRFPQKFLGLCGMAWQWDDFGEVLKDCLKNKEMIGLKLRFDGPGESGYDGFQDPKTFEKISQALNSNPKSKVILIHTSITDRQTVRGFNYDFSEEWDLNRIYNRDLREVDSLVRLAEQHPKVKVLIAHSMGSGRMINHLTKVLAKKPHIMNVYLDISGNLRDSEPAELNQAMIDAWIQFGSERILFGSDEFMGSAEYGDEENEFEGYYKRTNMAFDQNFLNQIFYKTGPRLLHSIGRD